MSGPSYVTRTVGYVLGGVGVGENVCVRWWRGDGEKNVSWTSTVPRFSLHLNNHLRESPQVEMMQTQLAKAQGMTVGMTQTSPVDASAKSQGGASSAVTPASAKAGSLLSAAAALSRARDQAAAKAPAASGGAMSQDRTDHFVPHKYQSLNRTDCSPKEEGAHVLSDCPLLDSSCCITHKHVKEE